jgi:hypothetical protein
MLAQLITNINHLKSFYNNVAQKHPALYSQLDVKSLDRLSEKCGKTTAKNPIVSIYQQAFKKLIEKIALENFKDENGFTLLMLAVIMDEKEVLELFLKCPKFDVLAKNQDRNLMDLAAAMGRPHIVALLLQHNSFKNNVPLLSHALVLASQNCHLLRSTLDRPINNLPVNNHAENNHHATQAPQLDLMRLRARIRRHSSDPVVDEYCRNPRNHADIINGFLRKIEKDNHSIVKNRVKCG